MTIESKIIKLIIEASQEAKKIGIPNILQPGLVKEMMMAEILGHKLIQTKRNADACDPNDEKIQYEYLSCYVGGSGQFDRMFKEPLDKRKESLYRIKRNKFIYMAFFSKSIPLHIEIIYQISPSVMLSETERQLDRSRNSISHVGFNEKWAKENGIVVFSNRKSK